MRAKAYISKNGKYRYWLLRTWDDSKPTVCFIGVNPSTADAKQDDPTIRREIGFARRWGYGSLLALNVGAFRSTDPQKWRKSFDPIGPENTVEHLSRYIRKFRATRVLAAWGKNGNYFMEQFNAIADRIPNLRCLGLNVDGSPKHPLMVPYAVQHQRFLAK
jgi:hypothetical protein